MTKLFITGYMGSGKSTVGQQLAKKLSIRWIDTDDVIESLIGQTISDYFQEYGESTFREIEKSVFSDLLQMEYPLVISTGGGTLCNDEILNKIKALDDTKLVYLYARVETLSDRVWAVREKKTYYRKI